MSTLLSSAQATDEIKFNRRVGDVARKSSSPNARSRQLLKPG
jgi:hypothetical protein